jgi:putative transposase
VTETIEPMVAQTDQQQFAQELVDRARAEGLDLIGPDGLLSGLTKTVLETALEAEMSEHLGYDKHDPVGRNQGNSRNGTHPRRCSPRSARSRSRCPGIGRAVLSR